MLHKISGEVIYLSSKRTLIMYSNTHASRHNADAESGTTMVECSQEVLYISSGDIGIIRCKLCKRSRRIHRLVTGQDIVAELDRE